MSFPFILMRHADSEHNKMKREIKNKFNVEKVKQLPQYQSIKYSPSLLDQSLTPKGKQQCQSVVSSIDWENVQFILVSPLIRCLQTTQQLLKRIAIKPKVFVEPLLASRLANIWSVGTNEKELKSKFAEFQFKMSDKDGKWFLSNLTEEKEKRINEYSNCIDGLKTNLHETYEEFKNRIPKIKHIVEKYKKKLHEGKRIMIISHSCVLKIITAEKFKENGKAKGISDFQNAVPVYFNDSAFFKAMMVKS